MNRTKPLALTLGILAMALAGCESIAVTSFGVGASTAVSHSLTGIAYRTFTLPMANVAKGTQGALARMGFKVESAQKNGTGEVITASGSERAISIELERLSPTSTRMRAVVRQGVFYDSATATEIILQTEKLLAYS